MSSKTIRYWCDSGANMHSCLQGKITLDELCITEEEWNDMSEDEKDDVMRDIACDRLDWGYSLEDKGDEE